MYTSPLYPLSNKQRPFLPSPSFSTAVATPANEEDVAAARNFLRTVISSSRASPRLPDPNVTAITAPSRESVGTQTDTIMPPTSLEGLIRAAGFSLANFATELKTLERRIENQHSEILRELKNLSRGS
jgi:hypothetical protein